MTYWMPFSVPWAAIRTECIPLLALTSGKSSGGYRVSVGLRRTYTSEKSDVVCPVPNGANVRGQVLVRRGGVAQCRSETGVNFRRRSAPVSTGRYLPVPLNRWSSKIKIKIGQNKSCRSIHTLVRSVQCLYSQGYEQTNYMTPTHPQLDKSQREPASEPRPRIRARTEAQSRRREPHKI